VPGTIDAYTEAKYLGYDTLHWAESAWVEWEKKVSSLKRGGRKDASLQNAATLRPWMESMHAPVAWMDPPDLRFNGGNRVKLESSAVEI
jgi:hypothetical protein